MLDAIQWDSGALSPAFYNLITWSPTTGSLVSSQVTGQSVAEAGMHTPEGFVGNQLFGWLGDFYYRIHITTLSLDLGNLVSDQTEQVTLWNAHRRAWMLIGITEDNADGITISGQPVPPLQYAPLQERTYTLGISTDGPATIDATLTWEFSSGEDIALAITGNRIVAWSWAPNWADGMLERLEWRTDVLTAYRGGEQRRALRLDPRQGLEFSVIAQGADRRFMEAVLWNWGARIYAVPLWFDGQELAGTLSAGATSIPLPTTQRGYTVGGLVMLLGEDPRTYEVLEVASIGASIGLARPTQQTWVAGTRVYPTRAARITNEATLPRFTGEAASLKLQFEMTDYMPWAAAASPTYRGYPVFEQKPDWSEDPSLIYGRKLNVMDSGSGRVLVEDQAQMPLTTQRMRYTMISRADVDAWKQRIYALRGKLGGIWVPTWASDLTVAANIGDSVTNIDIDWIGYGRYYGTDPNRRDIRIEIADGTIFYRRITGAAELSSTVERLSIDSALGVAVAAADVRLVSFMAMSRSDSDTAEIAWFTGEVAETVFSARGFRNDV